MLLNGHKFVYKYSGLDDNLVKIQGHLCYAKNNKIIYIYFFFDRETRRENENKTLYLSLLPGWFFKRIIGKNLICKESCAIKIAIQFQE